MWRHTCVRCNEDPPLYCRSCREDDLEELQAENERLKADLLGLARRLAAASEALGRAAERRGMTVEELLRQP